MIVTKPRLAFGGGTLAVAAVIAAACGFPSPELIADPVGEGGLDASTDALIQDVFAIEGNQNVDPTGSMQEASTRPPDAMVVDAAGCVDKCDCDEDTIRSSNATCADAGLDCNDLDPFIPHDGFVDDLPPSGTGPGYNGDWNCDNEITKQLPVNIRCGFLGNCAAAGFVGDPPCGVEATYVHCAVLVPGVSCTDGTTEPRKQGCK